MSGSLVSIGIPLFVVAGVALLYKLRGRGLVTVPGAESNSPLRTTLLEQYVVSSAVIVVLLGVVVLVFGIVKGQADLIVCGVVILVLGPLIFLGLFRVVRRVMARHMERQNGGT